MASNYERIQASRQRFREQAQIDEDSYNKFRQAYVQQVDGDALAAGAKESADRMRQALRESTGPAKPQQVKRAFAAYNSQIQRLRAYTQAGGSLPGDTRLAQLEREFAQQRADFTAYLREQQSQKGQPGGALGRQTVDAAQTAGDNRFALRQGQKAAEAFLDTSRLTPQQQKAMAGGYASYDTSGDVDRTLAAALTGSGTLKPGVLENAQRNRQRMAYQEAAQAARDSGAVRAGQYNQAQEKLDLVDDAITALEKMYPTKDARVLSSQQGVMRSYADRLGITDYTDRDDLLQQLRAQRSRQTRRADRQAAAAAEQATRYRTALALEYQLDNPDESLDANYLKRQRDEAARAYAEKKTFRTREAYEQAEAAYQEQKYRDDQESTILEIRQDGELSRQYQTALEATRGLTAAETALNYVKSDLERDGAVNRDTLGQVQQIAAAAGLTLPAGKTDNELRTYLEKLTAKYRSDKNFTLANLAHAGYDADKLEQYITRALNAQKMDEYTGRAADFAADSPVGASAASSAANLVSGMGYLAALPRTVANAWRIHTGNPDAYVPLDENSDAFRATRYAETIRQEVARQLQGKTDGKTASFLYETGMSMLDNILQVGVGMGLLGAPAMAEAAASGGVSAAVAAGSAAASPVSLGMMGLTTASQKLLEMTEEGVDTTTAYNLATAAGAIEVLTEKIGLDEFINGLGRQTAATTLRRIGQQVGRQTLAEGTEEAASDVLNLAADLLLRMDQADFVRDIDQARRQGLSKGEAVWSVVENQLKQTGVSFAGGALSGALFGLGGAAMNAVSSTDRAMGRQIQRTGGTEQLQKDAAAYGLNADNLTRESSPKELGAMQRQIYRAAEKTAGEIEAFARQKGYKKAAADALQAAWQGYKETGLNELSPQEFGVAFDTAYQEGKLDAQYGRTGAYLERAATDALTAGLLPETVKYAYLAGTKDGSRAASRAQSPIQTLQERAAERRARRAEAAATAATGAVRPGGGLTVMQLDDYTAKLRTAEGKTVTADQLETDAPERQIILQAQDDGYGPQEANALLAHYDGSMAPEAYYEQFREAITAGQDGESLTEARRRAGSGLTAEATKAAWELGQEIQTFLDTDERVGPAGKQALDAMAYGDAGLFEAYYKAGLAGESFAEARGRIGQMTDALEAKLRAAVKAGVRDAQGGFSYGKQEPNRDAGRGRVHDLGTGGQDGAVGGVAEADAGGEGPAVAGTAQRADAANPGEQKQEVEGQKNSASTDERAKLDATFDKKLDQWLENKGSQQSPRRFHVGTTSEALQSVGMAAGDIYWDAAKIAKIMQEHPEMSARVIKQVPQVLENPILVMQSQTRANRIVLFGEALDDAGKPVLVAMELQPRNKAGEVMDFAVIASAYGKGGAQQLIDTSEILYIDPDKKRTDRWFSQLRLQLPSRLNSYGPIGTIAQVERDVNGQIAFGETEGKTAMQLAMERALAKRGGTAEPVSARELGIGNGTERKTLRVIRPEALTQEQRAEKERLREKGITLTFVEGRIELVGPDDATRYAKGVCVKQKNAIVVRTDAQMPWQKIVRHEEQHAEFARNPQLLATRWNEFVDHLETEQIDRWVAGYAERYGGLYDAANLDALIEEALCDYAADIEAPEATERYWREVFPKQKETWKQGRNISDAALYRMKQDAGGQKNSARAGGRASIEEAEKGRYDYKKSFAEQLEDWKAGKIPKADTLVVGPTPEVFRKIGFNALPVTINQTHVDYAINGTKNAEHQIGEAMLRQLPQAMQHPVAIIASETQNDTSVVALLPFTHQGNTVVLPVVVDGFGFQNSLKIDSNAATSVYGRGNAVTKLLTNAINGHNNGETTLFYLDKIKATALYRDTRVTMPKGTESNDGFYHSIRDAGSNVKPKFADVTESRQFKRWFGDWQKKPRSASKVVNADGTPKVVYHGTAGEFNTFRSKNGAYFFSESLDYAESMMEERKGSRIIQAYLDMRRPLRVQMQPGEFSDPAAETKYLREAKANGNDGVIFELRTGNELVDDTFYVVFSPTQIKSATDNIGTFDRGEEDIRYSVDDEADTAADRERELEEMAQELEDERKRSKALESVNRRLREQMKVTPPGTADPASLRMAAKQLSEEYGGALRQKDVAADLQKIWRLRSEGKRGQMMEQVDKLASELVQHYLDKDNPEAETLREIKQTVRATKIYLTPELRGDLDLEGGYQDFRRRNFGRIRLANSGLGVDQFYQELSEQWPAYFPAGIWNPADQLLQIADVIQDGTTVLQRSPMEAFPDGMTYMRNKVLWELGLVRPAKPTAADKVIRQAADAANRDALIDAAAAHEQEQIDKLTAWHQKQLQKVKADREDRIQKVKDHYQERAQAERDRKAEQELKRRLLWHGNRLKRMGRTATPEQQAEIGKIIGEINLACQNMTKTTVVRDYIQGMSTESIPADGYRDRADPRRTMSAEEAAQNPEMRGDKVVDVSDLKAWYEEQKKSNPDFIADRRVEEILANMDKKQIGEMTPQEVQQLLDVALNIENEIRTQKKLIDAEDRREIYQQVLQIVGDIEGTRGRYDRGKLSRPSQWITENTLTPVRLLRRWTGFHDSDPLYQAALALQDGELKQLDYQRRAYERFEEFTKDKKFMDHLAGKGKQKPIEVTGINEKGETVHVKITPDMRVALYLHSRNYQNLRHIQRGGITVPQYEAYVKGNYTEAYDRGTRLRLMPRDVRAITDKMTTREKNYAERVAQYYDTMSKAEINGVSVKLKGYEIAKVQRYYPIETDKAFIAKEFDALRYDGSVEGKGFLKERQEGGNPILLRDATRTLQKSIRDHALYVGMAIPIRNFNKLRGVSISKSDETGALRYQENSLMKALEEKWGTQAVKHLEQMVTDLSGAQPPQASGAEMLNRIRSNYAGAVLELNPSTGMKQLIAYPSAASVLGWDAMAVGLTKWQRVNVKLINRYTPLLWHRMQGFIDADLGDYAKNHGHTPRFLNWNQAGDLAVVKQIWKAAEWKVAHDDRTLLHDVEKWHKATAELFNRVVLESQANYTTMERGEILRTNNVFLRSIAMFKTEPFQAFNVLYDAFANTAAKRRQLAALQQQEEQATAEELTTAENAYRDAKKRIAQAVPAVIASNLLEASIVFAWALFRGKDKDWRDEETDEITAASFFKRLAVTAAGNISGIIPYGSEITELLQAAIGGDRYYGVDILEASALTDMAETLLDIKNTVAKMFEKKETDEERLAAWGDTAKELVDETLQVLQTLGLPAANIHKSVDAIARWALRLALGKDAGEYTYRYYTQESTATGRAAEDAETMLQLALDGENEKLERVYEMATRIRKADDVGKAVAGRIRARVKAGTLDAETAAELLQRFQPDKDADELYWKAREWAYKAQTGAESFGKYTILKDALRSGGDVEAALKELEEHGIERDAAITQMHSQIGAWYTGTSDDGKTIQKTEALQLLQKYSDENEREAEETVREWTCKKETGYAYSELSAAMVDGEITKEQAVDWLQRYGGKEKEAAQSTVKKWTCEKETGYAYGELREALQDGEVTEKNVAKWLQQYGGKDEEDATQQAAAWVFAGKHPELADKYGDEALESIANSYAKYGAGIPAAQFAKYKQDLDKIEGDPDGEGGYKRNTRKPKVYAYIAQLPLTPEQKDSLVHVASGSYNLKGTPW